MRKCPLVNTLLPLSRAAVLAVTTLAVAACGISEPSSNRTDTFTGTVPLGGIGPLHSFSVGREGGEVDIKLTDISPDSAASLGIRYGQFASGSTTECLAIAQTPVANKDKSALAGRISKGTFCVVVFDSGFLTRAENYTLAVSHP
jgi:hypothetical protein